jgi:hypothetical protein
MEKIDIAKELKEIYRAAPEPREVEVAEGTFLSIDGQGAPGSDAFKSAMELLFGVAYTLKYALKKAGVLDFKVPKLECLWRVAAPETTPMSDWRWRAMLRIPDEIGEAPIEDARRALRKKKGLDAAAVTRTTWKEGRSIQMLHVGPYDHVDVIYRRIEARARELGMTPRGPAHEVYINDPRRTAPARLKTLVRLPVGETAPAGE